MKKVLDVDKTIFYLSIPFDGMQNVCLVKAKFASSCLKSDDVFR